VNATIGRSNWSVCTLLSVITPPFVSSELSTTTSLLIEPMQPKGTQSLYAHVVAVPSGRFSRTRRPNASGSQEVEMPLG